MALTRINANMLRVMQSAMERTMLGISFRDKIMLRTGTRGIIERISILKWSWVGHVARDHKSKWISKITFW